jgi:hypothetical protein
MYDNLHMLGDAINILDNTTWLMPFTAAYWNIQK